MVRTGWDLLGTAPHAFGGVWKLLGTRKQSSHGHDYPWSLSGLALGWLRTGPAGKQSGSRPEAQRFFFLESKAIVRSGIRTHASRETAT